MPKQDFYDFIDNVQNLLGRGQTESALSALENAPRNFQFRPDYLYLRGTAKSVLGRTRSAIEDLEEVVRRDRDYVPAYANLATAYVQMGFMGHAWRHAENYLRRDPNDEYEAKEQTEKIMSVVKAEILDAANTYGVSLTKMRRAAMPHERAQICLQNEDFRGVLKETKTAIRLVPQWPSPRNNRATTLFVHGKIQEAISELEVIVEDLEPENIFALSSLVIFNINIWEKEKAEVYAAKLRPLTLDVLDMGDHINKVVEAFGWLEDDETLGQMAGEAYELYGTEHIPLQDATCYILGAGAANTGQLSIAKKLFQKVTQTESRYGSLAQRGLDVLKKAKRRKKPVGPALDGRFPTIHFMHYWQQSTIDKLEKAVESETGLKELAERYSYIGYSHRLMLWQGAEDELEVEAALESLASLDLPQAYAEIERFATSKYSTPQQRINALRVLSEGGQIDRETPINIWREDKEDWAEVRLVKTEIVSFLEPTCSEETLRLIEKGVALSKSDKKANLKKALSYFEQALELEPDYPATLHNMGVVYQKQGREKEAMAKLHRSVEVDPDYLFGHLTLARLAFYEDDNEELCREHLAKIMSANKVVAKVYEGAVELQVHLAIREGEYEAAERMIDMLIELNPDSEEFYTDWLERIQLLESFSGFGDFFTKRIHNYHDRQFNRTITEDEDLESCVNRVSKDRLKPTLETWGLSKKGRKAEVVTRIVEALTNPGRLHNMIEDELSPEERDALAWVLEGDGLRSWDSFTERFGDIYDESPHWQYHIPETIPGRLQMLGFLAIGTLDNQRVTLIPRELRSLLGDAFGHNV